MKKRKAEEEVLLQSGLSSENKWILRNSVERYTASPKRRKRELNKRIKPQFPETEERPETKLFSRKRVGNRKRKGLVDWTREGDLFRPRFFLSSPCKSFVFIFLLFCDTGFGAFPLRNLGCRAGSEPPLNVQKNA